ALSAFIEARGREGEATLGAGGVRVPGDLLKIVLDKSNLRLPLDIPNIRVGRQGEGPDEVALLLVKVPEGQPTTNRVHRAERIAEQLRVNLSDAHAVKVVLTIRANEFVEVAKVCNGVGRDGADARKGLSEREDNRVAYELNGDHMAFGVGD